MNVTRHGNIVARVAVVVFLLGHQWTPLGSALAQAPRLSPGAQEVSVLIGAQPLIEEYYKLSEKDRGASGSPMSVEALTLRQRITEEVISASLEADGVISEIDSELERLRDIRLPLEARRDRQLQINAIANIVAGAVGGVAGSALQISSPSSNAGNVLSVVGGAASAFLGVLGLRIQSRGGVRALTDSPNMLAPFFDQQVEYHSRYPEALWKYLNSAVPTQLDKGTRRDRLFKEWVDEGDISMKSDPKEQAKIALLTSPSSEHDKLTIDLIDTRSSMLLAVRVWAGLFKRDLSKLMLAWKL
jgi:hypothetical protein